MLKLTLFITHIDFNCKKYSNFASDLTNGENFYMICEQTNIK